MAQFPCLPLWTDAWIADTKHLTIAKRGLYHDLLVLMWRTPGCRVPNDNSWLINHLGLRIDNTEDLSQLATLISEFCQSDGKWITQKRLKREFVRSFENHGRLSSLRKRLKNKENGTDTSRSTSHVEHSTPNSLPLTPKIKKQEKERGELGSSHLAPDGGPNGRPAPAHARGEDVHAIPHSLQDAGAFLRRDNGKSVSSMEVASEPSRQQVHSGSRGSGNLPDPAAERMELGNSSREIAGVNPARNETRLDDSGSSVDERRSLENDQRKQAILRKPPEQRSLREVNFLAYGKDL